MNSAKKPADDSSPAEDQDMQEVEEKVKRMLDPAEPDPEMEVPDKLPSEIKIDAKTDDIKATTAPEVKASKKSPKSSAKIDVEDQSADDHAVDVANKPDQETETKKTAEQAEEEPAAAADDSKEAPKDLDEKTGVSEMDDAETAEAVDEIARQESDELLEAEDKEVAKAFEDKKPSLTGRIKNFFGAWWHNRRARRATIIVLVLALVVAVTMPTSRYFLLNTVGVRSGASVTVLDESTRQPLKNVQVSLRGQTVLTDDEGTAGFRRLKLGATELVIEKRAFAVVRQPVTLGWGSNPLGSRDLTPVGSQYAFSVKSYLSGEPLKKVEAVSGDASAFSDENGKIKLTIDKTDDSPVEVQLVADDLREESLTIDADDKSEHALSMVPARKHVFISKRSGKYDVYKIDIDGKNEELVLPGTGSERDDMVLLSHPTKEFAALVSTRGSSRNSGGYLLSKLTLIDLSDNSSIEIARSERVQLIDWIGDRLIFVRIAAGASASNPNRHRLVSYDLEFDQSHELATSNFFNDVISARGAVFYAPSSAYQTRGTSLYKIDPDGKNREVILNKEPWNMYRTSYDRLTLSVGQDWYEYDLLSNATNKLGGEPANLRPRLYVDSPDGNSSLWVDQRDGKGVLLAHKIEENEDTEIHRQSGLKTPFRWLDGSSVVFRIGTDQETADYAISLDGGEPKKIRDVTNTADISGWYHY